MDISKTETPAEAATCSSGCCSTNSCESSCESSAQKSSPLHRALGGLSFAFGELLKDIGLWFLVGVLLAGIITALAPESFISANLGHGLLPMLLTLVVAVPMYVCATASTPIAAALALKGLSPGAAMVFLLAGPATNAASIAMVAKIIGKRATGVYLAAIVVSSLILGLAADGLYLALGLSVSDWVHAGNAHGHAWWHLASATVLLLLLAKALLPRGRRHDHSCGNAHAHR